MLINQKVSLHNIGFPSLLSLTLT